MPHFDPRQMSRQCLATCFGLRGSRLAQRCGRQLRFNAHRLSDLDRRFGFVEQTALTWRLSELLATRTVLVGLQNSQRIF
jgi:hypothetical protein